MKHNILKIVSMLFFLTFAMSCTKKLEEYNPSGASTEALLNTPEGFETAINGAYTYNRNMYGKEQGFALFEAGTDIWTGAAKNGNTSTAGVFPNPSLTTYQGLISDNIWIDNNLWIPCYAGINLCNTALSVINDAGLSATRRPTAEAELRFMRGWYYFLLVQAFGDVHFTLEPTTSIITTANRTPAATIYNQVIADMRFAVDNLPNTTGDYGRITKPGAAAILSKVLLTNGMNQEASNMANEVIKNFGLSLLPKYSDLWLMANEKNKEVLWAVNYSTNYAFNAGSNQGHSMFVMEYTDLPGMQRDVENGLAEGRYMPTLFYLNLFNENIDSRFGASFKQAWTSNNAATIPVWTAADAAQNPDLASLVGKPKFAVGDTAVFLTKYAVDDYQQNYTTSFRFKTYDVGDMYNTDGTPKDRFHYFSLRKFNDPTRASATESQSARDVDIIRLGEVYLVAAEAQFKLGKLDSAAYFINAVRTRAAMPGSEDAMKINNADVTLDFILDERARELGGEQMRWLDLKRTGKLLERVRADNPDISANIKDNHLLRPIPLSQMSAVTNKGEFSQNPGY